jgi:hypothetical protein
MSERRIPRPDADFAAWAAHYQAAVVNWWSDHGLDPADLKPLNDAWNDFLPAWQAHVAARAAAEAATAAKLTTRAALEAAIRPLTRFIQAFPETTDADRANIGITVGSAGVSPANAPRTAQRVWIESGQRLMHTLRFADASTPTRRGKPRGVLGAEVWVALAAAGEAPPPLRFAGAVGKWESENVGTEEAASPPSHLPTFARPHAGLPGFRFLSVSTSGALQTDFTTAEAGQTAYYALRWLSTRGATGPWSEIAAATVAG